MIRRLLEKNISIAQIAGYALANLLGLAIVMTAVRFYADVSETIAAGADGDTGLIPADYLVVSKPVSLLNTIGARNSAFSDEEIADLRRQPWATEVGAFVAADFNVSASIDFQGRGMHTFLFLEAIPDEFVDVDSRNWTFSPDAPGEVPIIIPKDYLALYNFGFAAGRGLPQLSESTITSVPLTLTASGAGRSDSFRARIVGFSSRLNTIAVPSDFIIWANARYGSGTPSGPSRLILKVDNPGDPAIASYLRRAGYETASDRLDRGRAGYLLTVFTVVVCSVGAVICLLSFFILMLAVTLLMQKSRTTLHWLMLLGYSPGRVAHTYYGLVGAVNGGVFVLAAASMICAASIWADALPVNAGMWPTLASLGSGLCLMAVVTLINFYVIRRYLRRLFGSCAKVRGRA